MALGLPGLCLFESAHFSEILHPNFSTSYCMQPLPFTKIDDE